MNEIENKILATKKMSSEQLEEAIKTKMASGARNRVSAANKVYREIAVEELGSEDVKAFFLQDYERKRGGVSVYLQTEDGETIRVAVSPDTAAPSAPLQIGQGVLLTKCVKKRNLFTGVKWMETTKDTKVTPAKMSKTFWDVPSYRLPEDGGIVLVGGKVVGVWPVNRFEPDGTRGEELPILEKGGAVNIRLSVAPWLDEGPKMMSCKIPDIPRLKLLVGDDYEWVGDEGGLLELADMFKNQPVRVFGSVKTTIGRGKKNEKEVNAYFDLRNFGFVIISPEDAATTETTKPTPKAGTWGSRQGAPSGTGKTYFGDDYKSSKDDDDVFVGEPETDESGH